MDTIRPSLSHRLTAYSQGVGDQGRGVTPDREVKLTRDELLKDKDSQLEAAIQDIRGLKK